MVDAAMGLTGSVMSIIWMPLSLELKVVTRAKVDESSVMVITSKG